MTMKIDISFAGETHSLTDGVTCHMLRCRGVGEAPVMWISEAGPQQHGVTFLDYRLKPRTIDLVLQIVGATDADRERKRQALLSWIMPMSNTQTLTFTLPSGAVRCIDVRTGGAALVEFMARQGFTHEMPVQFYAENPAFYDPTPNIITFSLGGGGDAFSVPMSVPLGVGASTINRAEAIVYGGTWISYPIVRIIGPVEDFQITNRSTGETLKFDGVSIAAGDYYEIDCRYGRKTVRDAAGANKIADLTDDSDLATFHFGRSPEVEDGINALTISAAGVSPVSRIDIMYFTYYLGI